MRPIVIPISCIQRDENSVHITSPAIPSLYLVAQNGDNAVSMVMKVIGDYLRITIGVEPKLEMAEGLRATLSGEAAAVETARSHVPAYIIARSMEARAA